MACGNNCSRPEPTNCGCGCGCNTGNNYVCIIVLYILLAIILGSCFF
ncbi:MAG: sporulation protein YjcZ [Bacilli bacterium]|nr:sporulation protein YjcZ [Bacilli bacterium]